MRGLIICVALALAGCSSTSALVSGAQPVEYTCAAGTAALKTAIALNDQLTPVQRAKVSAAATILNPYCSAAVPPTVSDSVQLTLTNAAGDLTAVANAISKR